MTAKIAQNYSPKLYKIRKFSWKEKKLKYFFTNFLYQWQTKQTQEKSNAVEKLQLLYKIDYHIQWKRIFWQILFFFLVFSTSELYLHKPKHKEKNVYIDEKHILKKRNINMCKITTNSNGNNPFVSAHEQNNSKFSRKFFAWKIESCITIMQSQFADLFCWLWRNQKQKEE